MIFHLMKILLKQDWNHINWRLVLGPRGYHSCFFHFLQPIMRRVLKTTDLDFLLRDQLISSFNVEEI